ncbi:hypothetical protein P3T23_000839 [Paraburkholderia sp. GAS448]
MLWSRVLVFDSHAKIVAKLDNHPHSVGATGGREK